MDVKEKNIALSILFTVLTCGLYGIYWFICLTDEINRASGEDGISGGMAFLFTFITCGLYGLYWDYKMGEKINLAKQRYDMEQSPDAGVLYLILGVFGLQIIVWALLQNELNKISA